MKKSYSILLILVLGLLGCFSDTVEPNELVGYQKKMVVNGVFSAGESVGIELTSSEAAIDSSLPNLIKDATVTLKTLTSTGNMTYDIFSENYLSTSTFNSGDDLNVSISHPDYPNVTSTISFPKAINASGKLFLDGGVDTAGQIGDLLQLTFTDESGIQNYYKLNVYYYNQTIGEWISMNFEKNDPSLSSYNSFVLDDAGVLFSDELFDGNEKTISTVAPAGTVFGNTGDKYKLELSSISKDFYKYYNSLQKARDAKDISVTGGFNNAVVIHSNIINGLGILAAQTKSDVVLK